MAKRKQQMGRVANICGALCLVLIFSLLAGSFVVRPWQHASAANTNCSGSGNSCPPSTNLLKYIQNTAQGTNTDLIQNDKNCTDTLSQQPNLSGSTSQQRANINNSLPYTSVLWISQANNPASQPVAHPGQTISLQLNHMEMICASLLKNNADNDHVSDGSTILRSGNFPDDNAYWFETEHNVNGVSKTETRTEIVGANIVNPAPGERLTNVSTGPNNVSNMSAVGNIKAGGGGRSRYWLSDYADDFGYTAPTNVSGNTTVTIIYDVKYFDTYHQRLSNPSNVSQCNDSNGNVVYFSSSNVVTNQNNIPWGACGIVHVRVSFPLRVITDITTNVGPTCNLKGSAIDNNYPNRQLTIDLYNNSGTKLDSTTTSGTLANGYHSYNFPRSDFGSAIDWSPHTYKVIARGIGSDPDATQSVDIGPCASLSCGGSKLALAGAVNQPGSVQVWVKVNNGSSSPPGNNNFSIQITGLDPGTNSKNISGVNDTNYNNGDIYSVTAPFTPTGPGNYEVSSFTYNGQTFSKQSCLGGAQLVGYTPYFEVQDGDIQAGGGFGLGTNCNATSGSDIRSWNRNDRVTPDYWGAGSQLAALATGNINDFVTGLHLPRGANAAHGSGLSFANDGKDTSGTPISPNGQGQYGGSFGTVPCMYDYSHDATSASVSAFQNYTALANNAGLIALAQPTTSVTPGSYHYDAVADRINGTHSVVIGDPNAGTSDIQIPTGKTLSLYINGNVYIRQNITYVSYTTPAEIPRFNLYVTGNIYIDPNVSQLHGVYVTQLLVNPVTKAQDPTTGHLYTCAINNSGTFSESRKYDLCNQQSLTFVGAVETRNKIHLDRTLGSLYKDPPTVKAQPAEVFQYSPELWLNGSTNRPSTGSFKSYTSLPPVL